MSKKKTKSKQVLNFDVVEVLGHKFKIIETDKEELLKSDRSITFGMVRFYDNIIYIDNRQSPQNIKQTFFHELLHAIDWISHNENCEYNEECINVLARGLMTLRID